MKNDDKRIAIFEEYPIPKAVFKLVAPTVIGMLVMMLYNLADTWFVGMLNDEYQTAAVSLGAPVILAFNAINNLFGVGGSSLMGRSLGAKDFDKVKKSSAFGIWGAIFAGTLLSVFIFTFSKPLMHLLGASEENWEYTYNYIYYTAILGAVPSILNVVMSFMIKTEGSALQASIGTMSGCLLNVILDPIFILPRFLNMGAAGAGFATLISNCVACLYFLIFLIIRKDKSFVCINPKMAKPEKGITKEIFSVGVPAAIQNLLNVTGMTILNNFAAAFGSDAVSAIGIAHKACLIPLYVSMGIASGATPIVAYNYGSKNFKRAKECVIFIATLGVSLSLIITVIYYIFSAQIMTAFIKTPSIINYGTVFIRSMCVGTPSLAMDFIGVGVYQAFGKGKISLFFAIARKILLEIPLLFILNKFFPLYGLAWAQSCAEFVLGTAAVIVLIRIFKRLEPKASAKEETAS